MPVFFLSIRSPDLWCFCLTGLLQMLHTTRLPLHELGQAKFSKKTAPTSDSIDSLVFMNGTKVQRLPQSIMGESIYYFLPTPDLPNLYIPARLRRPSFMFERPSPQLIACI